MTYPDPANPSLARYLDLLAGGSAAAPEKWLPSDLRAILDHQLDTLLQVDLPAVAEASACRGRDGKPCQCLTIRDLLRCPTPSHESLRALKVFAKKSVRVEHDLPPDAARYIYIISIIIGKASGVPNMSALGQAAIEREAARCLTTSWLSDDARLLLRTAMRRLAEAAAATR